MGFIVGFIFILNVFFALFYIGLSSIAIWLVSIKMKKGPFYTFLVVALVVLLPTWDVLLGFAVYYPAAHLVPKAVVYETVQAESVYFNGIYDGGYHSPGFIGRRLEEPLRKGFEFVEVNASASDYITTRKENNLSNPIAYKCVVSRRQDRQNRFEVICSAVDTVQSRYMVKFKTIKMGMTTVELKSIIDLSTNKLIGKCGQVSRERSHGIIPIPFFNWLHLDFDFWGKGTIYSPGSERYYGFEYNVIKAKKQKDDVL